MTANIDIFFRNNKLNAKKNTKESKKMSILLNNPYSNGMRIEPYTNKKGKACAKMS